MSLRPIDDCDACRDALTELVCDELDADTRAAVLAHTQTCEDCAAELSRFRGVMQAAQAVLVEAPSPRVHQAVMLAAREAQARRSALAQLGAHEEEGVLERLRTWLTRAGHWAMSPQVAMASVLLLMLGVGLVALPLGRDREQTALRAAEESESPKPASATATAAPAMEYRAEPSQPPSMPTADEAASTRSAPQGAARSGSGMKAAPKRASKGGSISAASEGLSVGKSQAATRDDFDYAQQKPLEKKSNATSRMRREQPFPGSQDQPKDKSAADDFAAAPPPSPSSNAPASNTLAAESVSAEPEREASPEAQLLAQGVRAAQGRDHAGAIAVLKPLAEKASPAVRREAALWLARSYRATNDCKTALRYYAPMTASSNVSPAVLAEAADCYERTGESKQASVLRSRAEPKAARPAKAAPSAKPAAASEPAD